MILLNMVSSGMHALPIAHDKADRDSDPSAIIPFAGSATVRAVRRHLLLFCGTHKGERLGADNVYEDSAGSRRLSLLSFYTDALDGQ